MRRGELLVIRALMVMVLAALLPGAVVRAEPVEKTAVPLLLHIELRGDLDSVKMVRDLAEAIARHREQVRSSLTVLIEPTGHRWREDVVAAMARVLTAEPRGTILVYLSGASGEPLGTGQAYFALIADAAYAAPKARVCHGAANALDELAPAEGNADNIAEQLRAAAWPTTSTRGASPLLLGLFPRPKQALWSAPSGENDGSWQLLGAAPEPSGGARPLVTAHSTRGDQFSVTLNTEAIKSIGLVGDSAHGTGDILAKRNMSVWKTERVVIRSTLAEARRTLNDGLRETDLGKAAVKAGLDSTRAKLRSKNAVMIEQARVVARRQVAAINGLEAKIAALEGLTGEYPEFLRSPAPGTTTLAATARQNDAAWKSCFQDRRDDLGKLRSRAQTIAATPDP